MGFYHNWVSLQSSVLADCGSGNPAQSLGAALFIVHICSLLTPLSCLHYSSDSTKPSHQPAQVLLILLRMLSICSPAEQQGTFQLQAALESSAVHQPCHHYTSSVAQRPLMELELVLQMASLCGTGHIRVGNCPQVFSLDPSQRHFLGLLLCKKATLASFSLEIEVS